MIELRVGLLGLGTIGTGVAQLLLTHRDLLAQRLGKAVRLVRICDLDITRDRGVDLSTVELTTDAARITEAPEFSGLDPDVWTPEQPIPSEHRLKVPKDTVKIYHSVGNFDLRTIADGRRNPVGAENHHSPRRHLVEFFHKNRALAG